MAEPLAANPMADPREIMRQLRAILSTLYPDATSARRLVDDAALPAGAIAFGGSAQNIWYSVLSEAQKHGDGVARLVKAAVREYPAHGPLFTLEQSYFAGDKSAPHQMDAAATAAGRGGRPLPPEQPPVAIRQRYALLVGVRDYVDSTFRTLPHTVHDVVALAEVLSAAGYTVRCLHSDQTEDSLRPTRDNIWGELENLVTQTGPGDLLLVHFAGHGYLYEDRAYLITSQTRRAALQRTAIDLDELTSTLANANAQARILMLDACHSGIGRSATGMDPDFERHVYLEAAGTATLAACRQQQVAYEHDQSPHGVFTYFLLAGLRGAAQRDLPFVTFTNLNFYVTDQVKRWAIRHGYQQTPNASTHLIGDPPLLLLPVPA